MLSGTGLAEKPPSSAEETGRLDISRKCEIFHYIGKIFLIFLIGKQDDM
jgi:hypothetical protein